MNTRLKTSLALAALALAAPALAQISLYRDENFGGSSLATERGIDTLGPRGIGERAASAVVERNLWEVCDQPDYGGRCTVLRPGQYPSPQAMGLNERVASVRKLPANAQVQDERYAPPTAASGPAQITFYADDGYNGASFSTQRALDNFGRRDFNDRASSVVVVGNRWEVCEDAGYRGRCVVLRQGRYPSLGAMGLNDRISSVRFVASETRIDADRYAPLPPASPESYRRQDGERIFQANVVSVHAVVGPPEKRCWIDHEQVPDERSNANVGGALAGALLGGILGHQVGGGSGKDLATAGGAVAGGLLGANVGREGSGTRTQDVQRCNTVPSQAKPEFWDVTYSFRGQEHRVQMTAPPGATVNVNASGEPRS